MDLNGRVLESVKMMIMIVIIIIILMAKQGPFQPFHSMKWYGLRLLADDRRYQTRTSRTRSAWRYYSNSRAARVVVHATITEQSKLCSPKYEGLIASFHNSVVRVNEILA